MQAPLLFAIAVLTFFALVRWARVTGRGIAEAPDLMCLLFVLLSAVGFPALWSMGVAAPWPDLLREDLAVRWSFVFFMCGCCGVVVGRSSGNLRGRGKPTGLAGVNREYGPLLGGSAKRVEPSRRRATWSSPGHGYRTGLSAVGAGLAGIGLLALLAPELIANAGNLVRSQDDGLTAGAGPALALASVPLWAVLYGELVSRTGKIVVLSCGAMYFAATFLTGQKSRFIFLALFVGIRWAGGHGRLRLRHLVVILASAVAIILGTTIFNVHVRGTGDLRPIEGVDPSTPAGYTEYSIGRFGQSTFDMTRTLGAVLDREDSVFQFEPWPLAGSLLSPVPSRILQKPPPASRYFAQEFFSEKWNEGTGVPPSLAAELTWYFGLGPAMLLFCGYFAALSVWTTRWKPSCFVLVNGLRTLSVPTSIFLVKGGTDGALRLFIILAVGLMIYAGIARALGRSSMVPSRPAQGPGPRPIGAKPLPVGVSQYLARSSSVRGQLTSNPGSSRWPG